MNCSKISASVSFVRMRSSSVSVERRVVARRLHALLQPLARLGLLDVRELDADRRAVRLAQVRDDLRGASRARAGRSCRRSRTSCRGRPRVRPKFASSSSRWRDGRVLERVDVGEEVTADAVRVDELRDAALQLGRGDDGLADRLAVEQAGRRVPLPLPLPLPLAGAGATQPLPFFGGASTTLTAARSSPTAEGKRTAMPSASPGLRLGLRRTSASPSSTDWGLWSQRV